MTKTAVFHVQLVQADYLATTIKLHKSGPDGGTVELRGDGMWQWGFGMSNSDGTKDHVRNHGQNICWAEWLHNGMSGMHTTILYAGFDEFAIVPKHDDYDFVAKVWELSHFPDGEVLKLTGGVI